MPQAASGFSCFNLARLGVGFASRRAAQAHQPTFGSGMHDRLNWFK